MKIWAEFSGILSGFREKRGCQDNTIILNSLIQIHLNREKGKLSAFFVDFESAFPSLVHNKLWHKLVKQGLSSKFMRMSRNLYEQAKLATGSVLNVLKRSKSDRWDLKDKLYNAMVKTVAFYGVEVWGLSCLDIFEKAQTSFYKRFLSLPVNSPNYAVPSRWEKFAFRTRF